MKKRIILLTGILCSIGMLCINKKVSAEMLADNYPVYGYVDGKTVTGSLSYSNSIAAAYTKHQMSSVKTARVYGVYRDVDGNKQEEDGGEGISTTSTNATSSAAIPNIAYYFIGARAIHSAYYIGSWSSPSWRGVQK